MSDLTERLRESTAAMAASCSAPMELWNEHSNAALSAAVEIERLRAIALDMQAAYTEAADEIDRLTRELAEARKAIKKLCDKAEEQADRFLDKWTSDLGATAETRAAGIAANSMGDFRAEIEVVLMKLEKKP